MSQQRSLPKTVYLSGGVGGARLACGISHVWPAGSLSIVVNTADDFEHWGLNICPDLDTVIYSLAQKNHVERGWGLINERFDTLAAMSQFRGEFPQESEDWFQLGNIDLATHLVRTQALRRGERLTDVTRRIARSFGLAHPILPMSDEPCPSQILVQAEPTSAGELILSFQDWLVKYRAKPQVARVLLRDAEPSPEVAAALEAAELILIGPSNPYVSIDPILNLRGVRERISEKPCFLVSPLISGQAVKGPLVEMLSSIDRLAPSHQAIVEHYAGLVNLCVVHPNDEPTLTSQKNIRWELFNTLIPEREKAERLAERIAELSLSLR